jgi:hypothetical protein
VTTGVAGRFGFQVLTRRWAKGTTNDEIYRHMAPVPFRFRQATVPIWPIDGRAKWPPPQHFDQHTFQAIANRWGGDSDDRIREV